MEVNEYIKYWIDSSDDDFQAMTHLFEKGDYKREFHKKCSNAFTKEWIHNITEFREWIKTKLLK